MKVFHYVLLALFFVTSPLFAAEEGLKTSPLVSSKTTKILGGIEAKSGDWPWMAALLHANEPDTFYAQFCGGVLIDETWVLTAAHCVDDMASSEINVVVGLFDLATYTGSRLLVKNIRIHPQYNETSSINDIALLELQLASNAPVLSLFAGESEDEVDLALIGKVLTALGWGWADDSSGEMYYPERLRQVNLPVVVDSYCNNAYATTLLNSQLCAGYYEGKDVCNGDSGGPVVTQIDDQWIHVGLTSYGAPCDTHEGWYGVYTRTSSYVDFIKQYAPGATFLSVSVEGKITMPWMMLLLNSN